MIKRNKAKQLQCVIGMLLTLSLLGGTGAVTAYAAESITLDKTYQTDKSNDDGTGQFDDTYEKDGVLYGLTQIKTEVVETIITAEEQYFWESAVFVDAAENHAPPAEIKKEDGTYRLIKSELREGKAEARSKYATSEVIYKLEYTDNLAEKGKVSVTDDDTGLEVTKSLPLIKKESVGSFWDDNFSFPVTILDYDAEAFQLGNVIVPASADLIEYADELLEYLGLPPEYYQVTDISWNGEAYEQSGILKREATASGRKLMTEIKAVYGGNIDLPALEGNYYRCTYGKEGTTNGTIYTIKAVATYEAEEDVVQHKSFLEWLLDWIVQHPIAAISIALLLLLLLVILILFVLGKKEEDEDEKMITQIEFESEEEDEEDEK